jgi:hypothetical protein
MMMPVGRLVTLRTVDKRDMIRAVAYIVWPGLVAPVVGPRCNSGPGPSPPPSRTCAAAVSRPVLLVNGN